MSRAATIDHCAEKSLHEILERVLDKEIIISGDLKLNIVLSVGTLDDALEAGLDWLPKIGLKSSKNLEAEEESGEIPEGKALPISKPVPVL